jgi:hypothetical protein
MNKTLSETRESSPSKAKASLLLPPIKGISKLAFFELLADLLALLDFLLPFFVDNLDTDSSKPVCTERDLERIQDLEANFLREDSLPTTSMSS